MRIDPKAKIGGLPSVRVRDALRRLERRDWSIERLQDLLGAEPSETAEVVEALRAASLIEAAQRAGLWRTTTEGTAFALATARPVSRAAAQRHLDGFLTRLVEVRDDAGWLYTARRVWLFGEFLDPAPAMVSSVDLAVELVRKEPDEEAHRRREHAYIQRQWDDGRIFRSTRQELACPTEDVLRYLKKRSWILNLHLLTDLELLTDTPSRLVYEDPDA